MKAIKKIKICMKAAIVIAVALAFVIPTSAVFTNPLSIKTYTSTSCPGTMTAIHQPLPIVANLGTDVLISSDNPTEDDETPKTTINNEGTIVVTYEKAIDSFTRRSPLVYSKDQGQTWTMQFEFDSINFDGGSGYLQSPGISYSAADGKFVWHGIDPFADQYNEELYWVPGDIENATEASGYAISSTGGSDYQEGAITHVGKWAVSIAIHTYASYTNCLGAGYMWYDASIPDVLFPVDENAAWAAGYYYDSGSILMTWPASQPEIIVGNDMYFVCQSFNGVYSNISFKATSTDLNPASPTFLFTSGGGPGGMDKYADIEAWPFKQFFIADHATDPEIGAKGDVVAVVYAQDGDVKCRTSIDGGQNWTDGTTVATGAGYPAAYVTEDKIYVAYVKDGNLFYAISSDNGATFGSPIQINDQSGTVVAQSGTVDVGPAGFVWTDNRDGGKDIYYEYMNLEPPVEVPILEITGITGGIGAKATIGNSGAAPATNVVWTITVTGGILGRIDVTGTDTIASIAIGGEDSSAKTKMILGLGAITVQVTATCDEGSTATLTKAGKQLFIFTNIPA
jgi:hypothetical protein